MLALSARLEVFGLRGYVWQDCRKLKKDPENKKQGDAHVTQVVPAASASTPTTTNAATVISTQVAHITKCLPSSHLLSYGDVIMLDAYVSQSLTEWKFDTRYSTHMIDNIG